MQKFTAKYARKTAFSATNGRITSDKAVAQILQIMWIGEFCAERSAA